MFSPTAVRQINNRVHIPRTAQSRRIHALLAFDRNRDGTIGNIDADTHNLAYARIYPTQVEAVEPSRVRIAICRYSLTFASVQKIWLWRSNHGQTHKANLVENTSLATIRVGPLTPTLFGYSRCQNYSVVDRAGEVAMNFRRSHNARRMAKNLAIRGPVQI